MAQQTSNSILYTGEFRHGIDPKNRITIPSAWRSGEGEEFYARIDSTGSCIVIYTPDEFRATLARFQTLPGASPREREIASRGFSSKALPCNADKQGRMVLPVDFCSKIGLNGDVVLVGASVRFEIWNPARWEEIDAASSATFNNLANQLGL